MVRPYMRPPRRKYAATCRDRLHVWARAARRSGGSSIGGDEAGAADGFLGGCGSGAPTSRPGCVSRVSGSTPPAESKKIHAKDSRTSRAVGCPSRCPSCAPRHSTICECRPPWREDLGPDWPRFPIARLHRTTGLWFLYWRDQNLKYHRYQPLWLTTSMTVQIPPSGDNDQLT